MTDAARLYPKSLTLKQLEAQVAAHEGALGPLKALGRNPELTRTVAAFLQGKRPKPVVELRMKVGDTAVIEDDYKKVCEGIVFITGQEQPAVAVRKKS
jgi:hypothetical protein